MKEVVIVGGVRTAIGQFGGSLKDVPVVQLGTLVIKDALKRSGLRPVPSAALLDMQPEKLKGRGMIDLEKKAYDYDDSLIPVQVDEVIMGNVLQAMQGQNTARQAMLKAGVSKEASAFTINKVCASGLKAITIGAAYIAAGQCDVIVAGGMENMSQTPYALPKARWGYRMDVTGYGQVTDMMVVDGVYEIMYGYHMGVTAENIAELYGISRQEQDELGVLSHQRARAAIANGIFKQEIVPYVMPQKKGDPVVFDTDERPMDTNMDKMAKLATVFKKDGTVTAGNASGINDAAAAVVMMSMEKARELGLKPIVKVRSFASGAIDPAYMGVGPVPAVKKALKLAGVTMNDIDVIELNEAFASQAIACMREMNVGTDKVNPYGSGISLGHPIGCTGARVTVTLMNEMQRKGYNLGMATMCIGGGQGMAAIYERV
nr:acetyl-CoA C-acetyltransferase [Deltaproteobacteria bacterium]